MTLNLNDTKETYREFYGRNVEQMPLLIVEGRVPMNTSELMQRRLDVRNSDAEVKSSYFDNYFDNYFDTGDAVVYHRDGRVKIVLDSELLRKLNLKSNLENGALVLEEGVYETTDGQEFTRKKLENYVGKPLTKEQAKENPVWRTLSRNQNLLNNYVDYIFTEAKERFNYNENMGVYIDSPSNHPKLRAWYFCELEDWSDVDGWYDLDNNSGRFVGLAPEALKQREKILEAKTQIIRPNLEQVLELGKRYVPLVVQEEFEKEIGKLYQ